MLSSVYHLLFTDSEYVDKGLLFTHVMYCVMMIYFVLSF